MPVGLLLPERWLVPPDGPAEIDFGCDASRGLLSYIAPPGVRRSGNAGALGHDLVRGAVGMVNGTAYENQIAIRAGEPVFKRHASQGSGFQYNSPRKAAPITILIRACKPTAGENLLTIGSTWNYDANPTLSVRSNGSFGLDLWISGDKTDSATNFFSSTRLVNNAIVADGTTVWAWKDAELWQTLTSALSDNGSSAYYFVGNGYGGTSNWELSQILVWGRVLKEEELRALAEAPYMLLRPVSRRFYLMPAGGADTTLAATISGAGSVSASLSTRIEAAATVLGAGMVQAGLSTQIAAAAAILGAGTVTADLSTAIAMAANVAGAGSVSGSLSTRIEAAAQVLGLGSVSGSLSTQILLGAAILGQGSVSAALAGTVIEVGATVAGAGQVSAALASQIWAAAEVLGQGVMTGSLSTAIQLGATVLGAGQVTAALEGAGALMVNPAWRVRQPARAWTVRQPVRSWRVAS